MIRNKKDDGKDCSKEEMKILESKRIILEEKEKIKKEKKKIHTKKMDKFKKTKFGQFLGKFIYIFSDEKNSYSFSEVFVTTLVALVLGAFACISVFMIITGGRNYFKISKELNKFVDVYELIRENYNGDVSSDKLVDNAISGMVSGVGDVYTSYSDSEDADTFDELVSGIYKGIGCTIQQVDEKIKVIDIYKDSPSEKAGLKVGDYLKSVDGKDAVTEGVTKLSEYIKYQVKDKISVIVLRDDKEVSLEIKMEKIETPVVSSKIHTVQEKKVGYIKISLFTSVATKQFKVELDKLEDEGIEGLIIDVRDNGGGYLTTVTDILNMLLPKGSKIYQIQKDDNKKVYKDKTSQEREYPIAVLANGNSASASEILVGAIKESYGGYIVGEKTFGKGTVQQVKKLKDGSMIKYTVENWLTPNGNWINNVGIEPTDKVSLDEEYYKNPIEENDNQLEKALELVIK